jgi:HEAT repeat protein
VRAAGVTILKDLETPRADRCLVSLLESGCGDLRLAVLSALVERRCPLAIPRAIPLLADPDEALRNGALDGLPRIDPAWAKTAAAREAFTIFARLLAGAAPGANPATTARALALIDPAAAVPHVLPLLVHDSPMVRQAALRALEDLASNWRTSEAASAGFATFAARFDRAQGGEALITVRALLTIDPRRAIPHLVGLLIHRDEEVRLDALRLLRDVAPHWARESVPAGMFEELVRLARHDHPARTVIFAARLLLELDPSRAAPVLLALLPGCDAEVFEMVFSELGPPGRCPAAEAEALILRAEQALDLGNPDHVRQQAVRLLAAGPRGMDRLIRYCEAARPKPTMAAREKAFLTCTLAEIPTQARGIDGLSDLKACLRLAFRLEEKSTWDRTLSILSGLAQGLAADPRVRARGLDVVAGGSRETPSSGDRLPEDASREAIIRALQGSGFSTPGYLDQLLSLAVDGREDKFVRSAAILALGAAGPREDLSDLVCRLLGRETEDPLTAAAVEAARRIREPRAVAPLQRFVASFARQAMTRFLVVRCLEAIFEILGAAAVGEMAFLLDQKHTYQSLYPFLKRCYDAIGLPTPAEVDSRTRIWLEEQRGARDPDRYVASLVEQIHEARKTGLPLAVIAAADTVKLRLVYNEIALDDFLMAYHQLRFRVSGHETKYIPLDARQLAEQWWVGGFWRNP